VGERVAIDLSLDGTPQEAQVNRDQLEQVLLNLAANARDAMPRGGRLSISTSNVHLDDAHGTHDYVAIAVTDTGSGMSPEVREKLFQRFFTTKESGRGLGLGLAAAHRFVEESSGVISVKSEVGQGTTVLLYLPHAAPNSQPLVENMRSGVEPVPVARGGETILVVENDAPVRRVVRALLEEQGYRVHEAPSGEEALQMLGEKGVHADLALVDVVMPGMSGTSFAGELKGRGLGVKVLFMSGHTDRALAEHGLFDVEGMLRKAFSPSTLLEKVREAIEAPDENGHENGGEARLA
jgi:CheY-like chemotaxis protein